MTSPTTSDAVGEFRRLSNGDPELQAHGKYYSCSFLLDMEHHRFLVRMHKGTVEELVTDPEPLSSYDFAIRADAETWHGFCQEVPHPCVTASGRPRSGAACVWRATCSSSCRTCAA